MNTKEKKDIHKILMVDDDVNYWTLVKGVLKSEGYDLYWASSGKQCLEIINDFRPHLILLDFEMQDFNGIEVLNIIRETIENVSVIFLSGHDDNKKIVHALEQGADDYITKPFYKTELIARINTNLRIYDLNNKLIEANKRLKKLSITDDLTGLFNMRIAWEKIESEIARGRRFDTQISLIMMDMDNFKSVNDDHDHLFGSFVIKEVGNIISRLVRKYDFGVRFGGDEFLICNTNTTYEGTVIFCEKLRENIENYFFKSGDDEIRLTVSIGCFIARLKDNNLNAHDLIKMADKALYDSKGNGRNQVTVFDTKNILNSF